MRVGYVYILTNEAMPGLVKIGKTTRSVEDRANQLSQTGVPFPFEIFTSFFCPDCDEVELRVHKYLADCRVNQDREFFLCDASKASVTVARTHREQVETWLDKFIPGQVIERQDMCLGRDHFAPLEFETGRDSGEIKEAIEALSISEVLKIVDEWRAVQ